MIFLLYWNNLLLYRIFRSILYNSPLIYLYQVYLYFTTYVSCFLKMSAFRNLSASNYSLMFGSSHGDCALDSEKYSDILNLCSQSQDLKASLLLYNYIQKYHAGSTQIIVWFSVFSPGFDMEHSIEKTRFIAIKDYVNHNKSLARQIFHKIVVSLFKYSSQSRQRGFLLGSQHTALSPAPVLLQKRAAKHMELYLRNNQWNYLRDLVNLTSKNNQKLTIILSPATREYKHQMKDVVFNQKHISEFVPISGQAHVTFIDLFNIDINNYFFIDHDHIDSVKFAAYDIFRDFNTQIFS